MRWKGSRVFESPLINLHTFSFRAARDVGIQFERSARLRTVNKSFENARVLTLGPTKLA